MHDGPGVAVRIVVLIAEDEPPIAEIVAEVVADLGCTPLVAPDGRRALALAREQHPALLVTDLMMPYLSGAELIAALRADAAAAGTPAVPVILMTAAGPRAARAVGADAVLPKPFRLDDLEDLVRLLLGLPAAAAS